MGQPIGTVYLFGKESEHLGGFLGDIKGTLKAERVLLSKPDDFREEAVKVHPVKQKLGPVFKARAGAVADALEKHSPKDAEAALAGGHLELALADGTKVTVTPEMAKVERASLVGNMRVEAVPMENINILVELPVRK
jgi:hypothetical protein